ncbi:protein-serine/threonine phosphatase [Salvia divinorum]|uniref:protein-serine/threonine phosphatase n=1 Tax=Salvia divinorum TaxID=28513 RepID=A0ABD1GFM7_SALDI
MLPSWFKSSVNDTDYSEIKLGRHQWGEFSMAAVKSDLVVQGYSQLESGSMSLHPSGPYGTFVGIYDGHGAPNASEFIKDHLFEFVKRITSDLGEMSGDVLDLSFLELEEQYLNLIRNESEAFPSLLYAGSSCLVGVVIGGRVFIANVGDSRAVLAQLPKPKRPVQLVREQLTRLKLNNLKEAWQNQGIPSFREQMLNIDYDLPWFREQPPHSSPCLVPRPVVLSYLDRQPYTRPRRNRHVQAIPLSTDHSAMLHSVRQELKKLYPRVPRIVLYDRVADIHRVKGILPTTRSIGDVYLKRWEFNTRPELPTKYKVEKQFNKPLILHQPALVDQELLPEDKFIIFASPELWKYVANEKAVDMVMNSSRKGIAMKLLKKALKRRARDRHGLTYMKLKKLNITQRRLVHDNISVVVLFLDHKLISGGRCNHVSLKSYEASNIQSRTDGASSSSTDGASGSHPHTGGASTSQFHIGEASTSHQLHIGEASTSRQLHIGEASTSRQLHIGKASTSQLHIGEASTSQPQTGEASTSQPHIGEASTSQPQTGEASTSQPHIGEASTSQPQTGEASTSQPHIGEASTSQPQTGEASTSQPHIGEASTSQPQTGEASTNQPHIGEASSSQPQTGGASTSQPRSAGASMSKSKTWPGFSRRYET